MFISTQQRGARGMKKRRSKRDITPEVRVRRYCRECRHADQLLLDPDEKGNPCTTGKKPQARAGKPYSRINCPQFEKLDGQQELVQDEPETTERVPFRAGQIVELKARSLTDERIPRFVIGRLERRGDEWWAESRTDRRWFPADNLRSVVEGIVLNTSWYDEAADVFDIVTGEWQTAKEMGVSVKPLLLLEQFKVVERDVHHRELVMPDGTPAPVQWRRVDLISEEDEI